MDAQLMRMIIIAVLVGFVVGGGVWYGWAGAGLLRAHAAKRALARKLEIDAAELLKQAKEPGAEEPERR